MVNNGAPNLPAGIGICQNMTVWARGSLDEGKYQLSQQQYLDAGWRESDTSNVPSSGGITPLTSSISTLPYTKPKTRGCHPTNASWGGGSVTARWPSPLAMASNVHAVEINVPKYLLMAYCSFRSYCVWSNMLCFWEGFNQCPFRMLPVLNQAIVSIPVFITPSMALHGIMGNRRTGVYFQGTLKHRVLISTNMLIFVWYLEFRGESAKPMQLFQVENNGGCIRQLWGSISCCNTRYVYMWGFLTDMVVQVRSLFDLYSNKGLY